MEAARTCWDHQPSLQRLLNVVFCEVVSVVLKGLDDYTCYESVVSGAVERQLLRCCPTLSQFLYDPLINEDGILFFPPSRDGLNDGHKLFVIFNGKAVEFEGCFYELIISL